VRLPIYKSEGKVVRTEDLERARPVRTYDHDTALAWEDYLQLFIAENPRERRARHDREYSRHAGQGADSLWYATQWALERHLARERGET
jgi:hypothetical protein